MIKKLLFLVSLFSLCNIFPSRVYRLKGKVYLIRKGKKIRLFKNKKVKTGDIINVGRKSYVVLKGYDGSKIKIYENSKYIVTLGDRKNSNYQQKNMLLSGKIFYNLSKLKKKNDYFKIYTPTSVCGVRGTMFEVYANSSGDAMVIVKKGKVSAYNDIVNEDNNIIKKQKIIQKNSGYYSDISGVKIQSKKVLKKRKKSIKKNKNINDKYLNYYYNTADKYKIKITSIYSNYTFYKNKTISLADKGREVLKNNKDEGKKLLQQSQSLSLKTFNIFRNLINKINQLKGIIVILKDIDKQKNYKQYNIFINNLFNKIEKDYNNY